MTCDCDNTFVLIGFTEGICVISTMFSMIGKNNERENGKNSTQSHPGYSLATYSIIMGLYDLPYVLENKKYHALLKVVKPHRKNDEKGHQS